jgi:hypothetical protein
MTKPAFHVPLASSAPLLNRRHSLAALSTLFLGACVKKHGHMPDAVPDKTKEVKPQFPFGSRPHAFAPKAIFPSASESERDDAVRDFYKRWKKKFIRPGCNPGELVVLTKNKPSQLTVSEAHGYGMIILAYMAGVDPEAKQQFDSFVRYHRAHPSGITKGIMSWNQNTACVDIGGKNGAIDGDLDIAYGLLLADTSLRFHGQPLPRLSNRFKRTCLERDLGQYVLDR